MAEKSKTGNSKQNKSKTKKKDARVTTLLRSRLKLRKRKTKKKSANSEKDYDSYSVIPVRYLLLEVFSLIRANWRQIGLFTLLYGAFYFILVRALTEYDVSQLRDSVNQLTGAAEGEVNSSLILTGAVFGLSLELNETSSMYALILMVIFSLAYLWLLRHMWLGRKTKIKTAFYEGLGPLVPFILVYMVIALELIPISIGSFVLGISLANDLLADWWEFALAYGFFILMLVLSGYLIVGGIIASYMATIPKVAPMEALRSAKKVLKGRRFQLLQRVIIVTLLSLAVAFGLLLTTVLVFEGAALIVVTLLSVLALPWYHTVFYTLYRSLIDEKS